MLRTFSTALALLVGLAIATPRLSAQDASKDVTAKELQPVIDKAIAYLKSSQAEDGGYPGKFGPGVTALVVAGLVKNGVAPDDPVVAKSIKKLESLVQKDGSIAPPNFIPNYMTSVSLMALAESNRGGKYDAIIKNAEKYIKSIQTDAAGEPTHGGFSYDGKGRPDMSNTGFSIDALIAAGIPKDDPALKKALTFLSNAQNLPSEEFNKQPFAKATTDDDKGGFVYNPGAKDKLPTGGLRSAGAMTYSGLKSFLYAGVDKKDPRVAAAIDWIRRHYTLEENPGMGKSGLFYYYQTFGKAMKALGEDEFKDAAGKSHNWRRELFDALKSRQNEDGSWQNKGDTTFAEGDKNLATAFALISLSYCKK